ncbi:MULTISPECIES: flagellar basal body rod protein FlgC [Lacrimispora]|uniref:Flagellar basal-body rod protein FlgC n=1 Tax=Lacrimispora sphenoides JCM 1415 TaxID=1297793 RepID=A0ABY1CD73_9FIRM|nr:MULTISPECIES: flagellar basal body rod protein FlgC [Lacrimispora]MDR7813478.1 flagellar basal body rod protein FlgC [Lacrimispora sp.]SET93676.1 flagellar basal-body rod protein FlgC [[Clostridium] sphenoides JCM 1415]SUY52514.1 flagellar basal-body rod protein FlgC [Lacrimispora sphenoides]
MSFLSSMNISASAMTAQRLRLDIASENIANIDTTRTEAGGPYQRKMVVLESRNENNFRRIMMNAAGISRQQSTGGVRVSQIVQDTSPYKSVYNPDHPDADENGYVQMPNVDLLKETVDSMSAYRSYEANITAFNAIKMMASKALEIGK